MLFFCPVFGRLLKSFMNMGSAGFVKDKVKTTETLSTLRPQFLKKKRRAEGESNRGPAAYQPNALPLGQAG